jgi:putative sterol carrier protein
MDWKLFEVVAGRGDEVSRALPEDVSITFEITGQGGGVWTVACEDGGEVRVYPSEPAASDCRVTCSTSDFEALLSGELDGRRGFLSGRLRIEGDVGLALRLQEVLVHMDISAP